jgi:hypothetical protein
MKNLKKISRESLKNVVGGIKPGMKKCIHPDTCQLVWGYIGGESTNCSGLLVCDLDFVPPSDGGIIVINP